MVKTYKCPSCGAPITFDGTTGKLTCEYCEAQIDVSTMDDANDLFDDSVVEEKVEREYCDFDGYKCESSYRKKWCFSL